MSPWSAAWVMLWHSNDEGLCSPAGMISIFPKCKRDRAEWKTIFTVVFFRQLLFFLFFFFYCNNDKTIQR